MRLRLIDAVTLAAAGLLVLKLVALLSEATAADRPPAGANPDFARALAGARAGYVPRDPSTTGSVTPREKPAEATRPAEARREAGQPGREAAPAGEGVPGAGEGGSPTERTILEKLAARREALKARSDALDLREQMLNEAERKLEAGVGEMRQVEDRADLGGTRKGETERSALKGIVTMYETMKPKDAARVFDRLGHDVLVPLVLAMNPRKMAEILAVMGPEPAERLTVALANRARGVETATAPAQAALPANELPALDPGPPAR